MVRGTKLITYREQLEARCRANKLPMRDLLAMAGVDHATWWRVRSEGRDFSFHTARKLEKALDEWQKPAKALPSSISA